MLFRRVNLLIIILLLFSCSKKDEISYIKDERVNPFVLYEEGMKSFDKRDFFFASKKFAEAEINFTSPAAAAKSAIMNSFSLYAINFYDEAEDNLNRYLKVYPADKYKMYAYYLLAIISYEQICEEKQ